MDRKEFINKTEEIYQRIFDAFEEIDPDIVEAEIQLDNITISFENGTRFVLNRQAATSQIWLATKKKGYHFDFDPDKNAWISDRDGGELFEILSQSISELISHVLVLWKPEKIKLFYSWFPFLKKIARR